MRVPCAPPSGLDTQTAAFSTEKMHLSPSLDYYIVSLLHSLHPVYFTNNPLGLVFGRAGLKRATF